MGRYRLKPKPTGTEHRLSISSTELLKEYSIGVTTTERVVEDVKIHTEYFASLEPK